MASIRIYTEEVWEKREIRDEKNRHYIEISEVYDILNSAFDDGTVKEYIVRRPKSEAR